MKIIFCFLISSLLALPTAAQTVQGSTIIKGTLAVTGAKSTSGYWCLQIDSSGNITNTGAICGVSVPSTVVQTNKANSFDALYIQTFNGPMNINSLFTQTGDSAFGDATVDSITDNDPQYYPNATVVNIHNTSTAAEGKNNFNNVLDWNPVGNPDGISPFVSREECNYDLDSATSAIYIEACSIGFLQNYSNTVSAGEVFAHFEGWQNYGNASDMWGGYLQTMSGNFGTGTVPAYLTFDSLYQNGGWSASVTYMSGSKPLPNMTMTGNTSGATASIGGRLPTWAAGTRTVYFQSKYGTFQAETVTFSNGATGTITGDLTVIGGVTYNVSGAKATVIGGYVGTNTAGALASVSNDLSKCGATVPITGFSGTSGTLTFTNANWSPSTYINTLGLYPGETITLTGFTSPNTGLNTQVVTVLEAGLMATQFEAIVTGSGYSNGRGSAVIANTCIGVQYGNYIPPLAQTGIGKTFAYVSDGASDVNSFAGPLVAGGGVQTGTKWTYRTVIPATATGYTGTVNVVLSASPVLTGTPTAPTQTTSDASTDIATDAFVHNAISALAYSPPVSIISTSGSPYSLSGSTGFYWNNSGAAYAWQLNAPTAGVQYCFGNYVGQTGILTITSTTNVYIVYKGVVGTMTTGTLVSGGAIGDSVCMVGADTTHYMVVGAGQGSWANY